LMVPNYSGGSIYNLANTILKTYGCETRGPVLDVDLGERIVLVLLDGLGYTSLMRTMGDLPAEVIRITSVFPTTTSTALASLFTALPPGKHGIVGSNVYLRELGMVVNTLRMSPVIGERDSLTRAGYELRRLFPVSRTIFEEIQAAGVPSRVYVPRGLSGGISRVIYAGAEVVEYVSMFDALVDSSRFVRRSKRCLVHVYIPTLDEILHRYGPSSEEFKAAVSEILGSIIRLRDRYFSDVDFIITSDHGHEEVSMNVNMTNHAVLVNLEVPPYGDARAVHLRGRYLDNVDLGDAEVIRGSDALVKEVFWKTWSC